ncbi:MAG: tetratricopeptide repeat protein [Kofleriaceae bacterium]
MSGVALALGLVAGGVAHAQPSGEPIPGADDPVSAPGLGAARPAKAPPVPLTAEELEVLRDIESEYARFVELADRHDARLRETILRAYNERTRELEKKYAAKIAKAIAERTQRQGETLALLEKFLAEHPDQPQFTPDAMFRLATLYLDLAEVEVEAKIADDPNALADYSKAMAMWQGILDRFPQYRQLPATLYLLGYYGKVNDERRSLQLFLSLSCANKYTFTGEPPPLPTREEAIARTERRDRRDPYADCQALPDADVELVRHAWVRGIADYQFSVPGELDDAIAAYLKVVDGGQASSLYAEALYKLAWSYYKRDFLLDAITRFDESVKLYDAIVDAGGSPTLELREESIQYIAVAFTDPWDGAVDSNPVEAFERVSKFYEGRGDERHVRDVWVAMGYAFVELQAWDQAIDSFRKAIGAPWELNPQNPVVHQEIVNTYELKGDKFAADNAAAELATRYSPGTAWYAANEKDREAMEAQRRIAERALYAAARNTHVAATNLRKEYDEDGQQNPDLKTDYVELYTRAIDLYATFITQYPDSDYVYEFTYFMGEALYYSERYLEAADQYKWVRGHRDLSETYFLDAAKNVIESYQQEAARQVAAGVIQPLVVPTSAELAALPQPLQARPIPEIYRLLQGEYDAYQTLVNDPKSAPQQGINAALVSLAYLHVDDAIARLKKVMASFCGVEQAIKAKDALLAVYEATGQLDAFEATNKEFIASKCGDAKAIELAQSQNRSLEFKRAAQLFAEKQYLDAAVAFYRFYKTAPADDADLPIALYNSAVNYKLGERPKTAISLFKEFTDNKDKLFRESPYYLEAKRLLALSYQGAFAYGDALTAYLDLYETAKSAKKRGINPPPPLPGEAPRTLEQISLDALYNAAVVAELDRNFKKAVELYGKYQAEEPNRRNKDRALWAVARIYRSSGDVTSLVATLDKWRKTYGGDAGNEDDVIQSYYDTAKLWQKKGRTSNADAAGKEAIAAWKKKPIKNSRGAKMAGEFALLFAEREFAKFEAFRITRSARKPEEAAADKKTLEDKTKAIQNLYVDLEVYGVLEYNMASKVRFGDAAALFGEKLLGTPIPKYITDLNDKNPDAGVQAAYEAKLGEVLALYVSAARKYWEEVVSAAKAGGISNEWSQRALESLNREFPDQFPVLHQELFTGTEAP